MEATARARHIRASARKMRLVADVIRKKPVSKAIALLHYGITKKASEDIERTLRAAVANLQSRGEGANIDIDDLTVKSIVIDGGPTLKRGRARAQGRYFRRLSRTSHIKIIISD